MSDDSGNAKVKITFLGVGSASQIDLGHASANVQVDDKHLLIDCGPGTIKAFKSAYKTLPDALFITHCHLDHIADFENLFIQTWFSEHNTKRPKIFVPANIIPLLNMRVATYPSVLAEGGVNFWDAFQLIPVVDKFVFYSMTFNVLQVRHHSPGTAYGLRLPNAFFYSGDTRPIPELLQSMGSDEHIFHDCAVIGNPSHTGIDDIKREYCEEIIERIHCYHYASSNEVTAFEKAGFAVVRQGQSFEYQVKR